MKIMVINGPNINMIGIREKEIYGQKAFNDIISELKQYIWKKNWQVECFQSNHEGDLCDWIQQAYLDHYDGIIINPGAYTHTSVAILDAAKAIAPIPIVEVHLSDIHSREAFRNISYISQACIAQVYGLGWQGYLKAVDVLAEYLEPHVL